MVFVVIISMKRLWRWFWLCVLPPPVIINPVGCCCHSTSYDERSVVLLRIYSLTSKYTHTHHLIIITKPNHTSVGNYRYNRKDHYGLCKYLKRETRRKEDPKGKKYCFFQKRKENPLKNMYSFYTIFYLPHQKCILFNTYFTNILFLDVQ